MNNLVKADTGLLQMAKIKDIKSWYNDFVKLSKDVLKEGLDYGKIPGVEKPTLLKPGAEKLRFVYRLQTDTSKVESTIEVDTDPPYVDYTYRTVVKSPDGQMVLASCEGNANSYEKKFRYVWVKEEDLPEGVDQSKLEKRSNIVSEFDFAIVKAETTGKYGKPAEYWEKWKEAIKSGQAKKVKRKAASGKDFEAYEMGSYLYRINNPDVMGLRNTIMKMAQKRSFVGAVMMATGASEFFTQDVEDMEIIVEDAVILDKSQKTKEKETTKPAKKTELLPKTGETTMAKVVKKEKPITMPPENIEDQKLVEPEDDEPVRQAKLKWVKALIEKGKIIYKGDIEKASLAELTNLMDNYRASIGK